MIPRSNDTTTGVKPLSNSLYIEIINIKSKTPAFWGAWPIMEQPGKTKSASIAMAMSPGSHSGTSLSSTRSSSSSASSSSSSSPSVVVVAADLKGKEKSKFVATRLRVFFGILIGYSPFLPLPHSLSLSLFNTDQTVFNR